MRYQDTVILLFAKAPVEGEVNTRLIPDVGVEAATQLQRELIENRLQMLSESELADIELHCLPDTRHECFIAAQKRYPVTLRIQQGSELGERMFNAASAALTRYRHCILLGTDAPALGAVAISQAIDILSSGITTVFVPAEDGGYVMLGLSSAHRCLFEDIPWGTENVMRHSRDVLAANSIQYHELATCWDIDRLADYLRYQDLKITSGTV